MADRMQKPVIRNMMVCGFMIWNRLSRLSNSDERIAALYSTSKYQVILKNLLTQKKNPKLGPLKFLLLTKKKRNASLLAISRLSPLRAENLGSKQSSIDSLCLVVIAAYPWCILMDTSADICICEFIHFKMILAPLAFNEESGITTIANV
ncbi:hypothetical protein BY458DRAFT_487318 [Sporodiniella umbellata]|nr:hypothetical protein BY458DRAFT_487318 [Sporodiniella umbellata]